MAIFHCYVSSPEGTWIIPMHDVPQAWAKWSRLRNRPQLKAVLPRDLQALRWLNPRNAGNDWISMLESIALANSDLEVELGIWTLALETCINARKTIHLTGFQPCFPTTYQWRHPSVPAFVVSVHMHLKVGPCCDAQLLVTGWGDNDLMTWNWFPVPQNDRRVLSKRPTLPGTNVSQATVSGIN